MVRASGRYLAGGLGGVSEWVQVVGWVRQGPVGSRRALVTHWQTGKPEVEGEVAALAWCSLESVGRGDWEAWGPDI